MNPIVQILPQPLINKIAAGEVIVRPASVVKELVENSFDAGARHVRVEISQDGRSISVWDDGCGMDEENAKRAILRHSTSKIREFEDLETLTTRGFRGEALASIIAVSRFELLTRPEGALCGTRLLAAGGKVERVEPAGTSVGATIHVRDLFYNTPARLKFLKSAAAEFNAAVEILTQQALTHPETALACVRAGAVRFDLPPGQTLLERIEELLGSSIQGRMLRVHFERGNFSVKGYICRPEAARKDRRWQYLMVNGRPILAKHLSFPIQEAYRGLLMTQRFPVVVLDIGIDPSEVDVNVHPTKEEVRFEDEGKVSGLLYRAVNQTLQDNNLIPTLDVPAVSQSAGQPVGQSASLRPPVSSIPNPQSAIPNSQPEAAPREMGAGPSLAPAARLAPRPAQGSDPSFPFLFSPQGTLPYAPGRDLRDFVRPPERTADLFPPSAPARKPGSSRPESVAPPSAPQETPPAPRETSHTPAETRAPAEPSPARTAQTAPWQERSPFGDGPPPLPLGQIGRTYIVAEWGDDLLLIDQHAAHERLIYRRLLERPGVPPPTQGLLVPIEFAVSPGDVEPLESLLPLLREMGIPIEKGAGASFAVAALPADFDNLDVPGMIHDVLDDIRPAGGGVTGGGAALGLDALRDKVLVRMSCHAAIKAGQPLSPVEMTQLIRQIAEARLSFTCPHGRPTMVLLRKDQLDRQFGRKQ